MCDEEERVEKLDEFKKCGKHAKLKRWLHGVRKAASGKEDDYAGRLVNVVNEGFQRSRAASTIFHHPQTHVRVVVHGDDLAFAATELRENRSTDVQMPRRGVRCSWQWKT